MSVYLEETCAFLPITWRLDQPKLNLELPGLQRGQIAPKRYDDSRRKCAYHQIPCSSTELCAGTGGKGAFKNVPASAMAVCKRTVFEFVLASHGVVDEIMEL